MGKKLKGVVAYWGHKCLIQIDAQNTNQNEILESRGLGTKIITSCMFISMSSQERQQTNVDWFLKWWFELENNTTTGEAVDQ